MNALSRLRTVIAIPSLLFLAPPALADVQLPAVFSSHMVLQRERPLVVWGKASPGETVTVSVADQEDQATPKSDGRWHVTLGPLQIGGPHKMIVRGKNTIELEDVLVGEVWVCSGQSNMAWPVQRALNPEQEIGAANLPRMRLFSVKHTVSGTPLEDVTGSWAVCSPQTVGGFSAVGFFFGRKLHEELKVPIGLIHTSWGGTPAEAWTTLETLQSLTETQPIVERWKEILERHPKALEEHKAREAEWQQAAEKAKAAGKQAPRRPRPPPGPDHPHRPAGLFNAMIHPLLPYSIRGAIWYQGESNAGRAYQYRTLFPAMIQDWRRVWKHGDFPFLFVQLANFRKVEEQPVESDWAELREAQLMTLDLPHTAMAVTTDIGDANDIHPRNKQEVGHRLALAALAQSYGRDIVFSGPVYCGMIKENGHIRLSFRHTGTGLVAGGGDELRGFAIAGKDKKFVWAKARIDRGEVIVWSDEVTDPVAVRYAWANNPVANLYNKEKLPATSFRTDSWEGVTAGKR